MKESRGLQIDIIIQRSVTKCRLVRRHNKCQNIKEKPPQDTNGVIKSPTPDFLSSDVGFPHLSKIE